MPQRRMAIARAFTGDAPNARVPRVSCGATAARSARYGAGIPDYLWQRYWWAYLSPAGVWLFDHQPVINLILLGRYRALVRATLALLDRSGAGRTLQIAAVYGALTPTLARRLARDGLDLIDVAPIQLEHVVRKLPRRGPSLRLARMNAESLAYADGSFDSVLLYFLLHELPAGARTRVLEEAIRVLRPGGALIVADYGELDEPHFLHLVRPLRRLFERCEPFLADFWRRRLDEQVGQAAAALRKAQRREAALEVLGGFYRVRSYRLTQAKADQPPRNTGTAGLRNESVTASLSRTRIRASHDDARS